MNSNEEPDNKDYGSPERLSEGDEAWECRSQELYLSDNPDQ